LFPGRKTVPKTLIFAKDDSHADDIVQLVREIFGKGNEFATKITYRTLDGKPEELLQAFRNSLNPRIVVTVDMIATGTDVKPLECLVFMRSVKSRTYFEQMLGRGVRIIDDTDFQAVTDDARESGMLVWENEAHGGWSFPLVALHEHPIEATDSKYFTAIMAVERRLSLKPRMRLVYVVTQLPASPEALRLFVDAARSYATGRFRESLTKNVALLSVPVAVIPTSQITQPKSHIRTKYTEVFVLLDSRTLEVLFQIPRRFALRTQAEEMIRSFLTVV
jgi:hypothetical protein